MPASKSDDILKKIYRELAAGKLGQIGTHFLTVRELAAAEKISLKTFINTLTSNQKFYFGVGLFISALIWLSNTFSLL